MHISLTIGAILLSFVHQFCCENKLESHIKGANFFVPSAPFNLTVKNITSNEIHLSWAKPLNIISQQVQAQPLFHHNDILANKDTVHIGPSKDLEIKHDHQGKDSILQANDAKIASSAQIFQENSESYQSVDDGVYRRRKRRRDLTSVPSDSSTSPKDTTSNDETTGVLQDDAGTESSKKSGDMIDISEDINPEEEHKKQNINYVLYYEEGASGESANSKNDDEIFKRNTIKEVVLEHQNGKDGIKGVKYALRDLKPYTNYRIWVRAFYAAPLSELTSPPSGALGLSSENVTALTDVPPPSAPVIKNLFCEQPPGTIILEWSRPESWSVGLDAYLVTLKRTGVGGIEQQIHLETNKNHIDTVISLPVDISNNVTYYEVTLQAATRSIVDTNRLINGSTTESYQVTMTRDCKPDKAFADISGSKPEEEQRFYLGTLLGIVIVLIAGTATFLALLILYRWGCASIFKRCLPMSSLLLRDGTTSDGSEGCGEGGTPGKADHSGYSKKIVSPTHTVVFWGGADGAGVGGNSPPGRELLWDESHPPVASDNFLAHTAALHADGDIGFGKEYDLIQSKSAMLGYTSNHSQHPDNRHKNRYLNITAYDHSRVCLLPSSCCSCEPGKEHRKSCASSRPVSGHQPAEPVSLHGDYVNANFIDGIAAELSPELSKFILAQNERRKAADRKKLEINTVDSGIVQDSSDEDSKKRGTTLEDIDKIGRGSVIGSSGRAILDGSIESKIPLGFETVDPMVSMAVFDTKMPINMGVNKEKLSLDLNVDKKPVDVSNNTCRLSINLDKKEEKHDDVKSEKSVKIGKKRSTSADTRDIVVDKKGSSRGHSKNSSVVVNINQDSSPSGGAPKIEGAFLNIEFSGIVDSERELQKAREAERIEEANRLAKEAAEESMDDLDRLYVQIDGSPQRVKSSWLLDRKRYIGTQGPTPSTLPAFWRMVWDHHVAVIVMITNLVERGRRKCDMYWPKDGTETYGAIQVSTLHEDVMATYTVRMFQIKNTKVNLRRSVVQYHYTVWPDHGTPEHPLAVLRFREAARRAAPPQAGAVLVHCSAGVGRTGTYIVLDAMLNHLRLTGSLNVFGFLCHVRSQRNFLVQTEEQYVFIHDALLEAIQSGDTEVPAEKAKDYLKTLLEPFPEGHRPDGSGAPDRRIGLYGAPLTDSEDVVPQNGVTAQLPIDDFGLWNSESTAERFGDDRTLDECRNELVSVSLQNRNRGFGSENPSSVSPDCNGADTSESKNSAKKSTEGKGDSEERDAALTKSPKSITAGSGRMIDFNDKNNKDDINGSETAKNDDSGSMSSANAVKSDHSTSYEKFNGTHAKTGDESKATSVSDEEADLLYGKARTNGNSKDDGNNGNQSASGDTNTVTSSISSDTNRLNNLSNFRDRPGYSPVVGSQDGAEVYRKERNARGKGDDNYEALGGGNRVGGGGPDSCFAGGHRFACQRRDSGGKKARNLLEHQFNLVCAFEPSKFHTVSADKQVNSLKNRKGAVLPVESGRVHLIPKPGEEGSDYINATWLQGHRSLREYVVTQHPLSNTVDDLYRLLWDHSCQLVVVLTDCDEDPECEIFWPTEENQEINAYNYCIRYMSQERHIAKRKPKPEIIPPGSIHKSEELTPNFILASNRPSSPLHSPSSGSCNKSFALKLTKVLQKSTPGSPNSDVDSNKRSPTGSHTLKSDDSTKQNNAGFYRRQSSADNQDEERLIPKSDEPPSLEGPEELKKLNSEEKSDGYAFERSELLHIDTSIVDNSGSPKVSPNKRQILNGDICGNVDDNCSKKQSKSPSKISLKSLRLHSPVLKSPTKFKFELGNRGGNKTDEQSSLKAMPLEVVPGFDPKFEMVEYKDSSQLRDGVEEIGRDCIITTTHMTMNSIQDDYELKVCLIQCPKWLADLDYDENSDTDEGSDDDEFELETKALDFVIERRLKAYRGVFGLPEYLTKCQDEFKNSPVVVIDKNGGARAASLCTLSGAIRRSTRDVYSLAKLHHGRRAGAWRRPSDLRALYEALAAYQHDN